jgi:hypothetical protein
MLMEKIALQYSSYREAKCHSLGDADKKILVEEYHIVSDAPAR